MKILSFYMCFAEPESVIIILFYVYINYPTFSFI